MSISYPRTLPTHTGIAQISLRATNAVTIERSPFTYAAQVQRSVGQMWQADVTLPPMKRDDAEEWIAWLASLEGGYQKFTMGDPIGATARGLMRGTDTVTVYGASQTGQDINLDTDRNNKTGYAKAGDYIQIGTGTSARLYKVLADANTDGTGKFTVSVWPRVRTAPADGATVYVQDTVGIWQLSGTQSEWNINEASIYGLSFSAVEAL